MEEDRLIRVTVGVAAEPHKTLELMVSSTQTVADTKRMALELDSTIAVDNLLMDGVRVEDDREIRSFPQQDPLIFTVATDERRTLEVTTSSQTGRGSRRRKRCSFADCVSAPLRGVGDCSNCEGHFCSRHRLMEQHNCTGLQGCKQQLHERNALKLQQQQTVPNKV